MAGESLRIISGSGAGNEIPLNGDFTVGRGEGGMGNLNGDPEISRRHARFRRTAQGQTLLEDLGSTNGTYVNGRRINAPTLLSAGDQIALGRTVLQFGSTVPQVAAAPAAFAHAPAAAVAQAAVLDRPGATAQPPDAGAARYDQFRRNELKARRRGILFGLVGLMIVAGIVVGLIALLGGDDSAPTKNATASASTVASDCGANIGKDGAVAYVSYVQSNIAAKGKNSVIVIPHAAGTMKPLAMSQCSMGGSGSTDLTDSGVLDANDQIIINKDHTLLFSANQGSDTIAVFHIHPNGGLKPVDGSPFPSNGNAPSSLGLSGNTLVVSNKAQDGVRDLKQVKPNYTTFTVSNDGKLTPIPGSKVEAEPGSSPTDASVPAKGGVAFGTEESGPIRGFSIDQSGVLKEAPGSPYDPPAQAFAPGYDDAKKFLLGVATHPSEQLVYIGLPTVPALGIFRYDTSGQLTFLNSVPVAGAYLPCWLQITKDGRWLYTSNAATNNITVFDLSDPTKPSQIQTLSYQTPGNPWNIQLSDDNKFLFGIAPRDTLAVPEGEGNVEHVMKIGSDGKLTEVGGEAPLKLPVPKTANPQGIAVFAPSS